MTAVRLPFLLCDFDTCDEEYGPGPETGQAVDETRKKAKAEGWSLLAGLDLCATHTKALVGKRPKVVANGPTDDLAHTVQGDD